MSTQQPIPITVLVVDDNAHMRSILKELLRAVGIYDVREAADATDALEILKSVPVDMMMADLSMPIIDGVEFTHMIRNSADSPNQFLPIIMITGHSERSRVSAARDAGVTEFLVKPVTAKNLLERIRSVVERPRSYVRSGTYFGPDRRRRQDPNYSGPLRRSGDRRDET